MKMRASIIARTSWDYGILSGLTGSAGGMADQSQLLSEVFRHIITRDIQGMWTKQHSCAKICLSGKNYNYGKVKLSMIFQGKEKYL